MVKIFAFFFHLSNATAKEEDEQPNNNAGEGTSTSQQQPEEMRNNVDDPHATFREAIRKIRFLTLTPKQFAENVVRTNILNQSGN